VVLARPLIQRRTIADLPRVSARRARAIVEYQAPRYFRVNGASLVIALCGTPNPSEWTGYAADEAFLDAVVGGADHAGLLVDAIRPAEEAAQANLLPPACLAARRGRRRRRARRVLGAGLIISCCLGVLGVSRWIAEARAIRVAADSLRAPIEALASARARMARAAAMLDAIDRAEVDRVAIARQVLNLARVLPDSVVLTGLSIGENETGRMTGLARRPLELVAELDRRQAVRNPRLEGGTLKETLQGRPWERFTLAFGPESAR